MLDMTKYGKFIDIEALCAAIESGEVDADDIDMSITTNCTMCGVLVPPDELTPSGKDEGFCLNCVAAACEVMSAVDRAS